MNPTKAITLSLATLCATGCVTPRAPLAPVAGVIAARSLTNVPPPSLKVAVQPPDITREQLSNGLTVYRLPVGTGPAVGCLTTGRDPQSGDMDGIVAQVAFEAIRAQLPAGATIRSHLADTRVTMCVQSTPRVFAEALSKLARAVAYPRTPDDERFRRASFRYLQDMVNRSRSSVIRARIAARRGRYGPQHIWASDSSSRIERVARMTPTDAREALVRLFAPRRSALVLVAGASTLQSSEGLDQAWAELKGVRQVDAAMPVPPLRSKPRLHVHALWYKTDQALVQALHLGPAPKDKKRTAALRVLSEVLGDFLSATNTQFRHQQGATYGVGTELVGRRGVAELWWGGWMAVSELPRAIDHHRNEIRRIIKQGIATDIFERNRQRLLAAEMRVWGVPFALAHRVAVEFVAGGAPSPAARWATYRTITKADVEEVARAYFDPDRLDVAIVGPSKLSRPLARRGRVFSYVITTKAKK